MNTFTKTTLFATAAAVLIGGAAFAGAHKEGGERQESRAERMMERLDADKDGRVTREEMVTAATARFAERDKDGDGIISRDDREAFRTERRENRRTMRFDQIDADDDGMISKAEFVSFQPERGERGDRGARGERRGMRRGEGRHAGHHRGHRGAHEGRGEGQRRGMGGPLTIQEAEARAGQRFDRLDSDAKGFVTLNDLKAARGERGERRGRN